MGQDYSKAVVPELQHVAASRRPWSPQLTDRFVAKAVLGGCAVAFGTERLLPGGAGDSS